MRNLVVAIFLIAAASFPARAQESGAPPAIYKPGADIMAELDRAAAASASAGGWSVTYFSGHRVPIF